MVISYRERIVKHLQQTRPNLSASSLKTYSSVLYNLYKNMHGSMEDINWFSANVEDILKHLADKNKSTQKSTLSALFVLTGKPIYREEMMKQSREINKLYKEQKKTEKQERNWLSTDEIKSKYDSLHEKVKDIFSKKMVGDVATIIDYLLVALLSGVLTPPRRSLDYALLKWRNYNPQTDNYYKRGKLYLNKYKTSDTYGLAKVDVPKELDTVIRKWLKVNPSDYVLISSNNEPLSSSQITRRLNAIFGKRVSVNMLRHMYLTNFYMNTPPLKDMEKVARDMGHNVMTALEYVKK